MVHLGNFNPRPPCGRRRSSISMPGASRQFQSSLPMREATQDLLRRALTIKHFNPRLPCGRRLGSVSPVAKSSSFQSPPPMRGATVFGRGAAPGSYISTHAPHAGSDWSQRAGRCTRSKFQPTLPMRGATGDAPLGGAHRPISTHAPHAGSDCDRLRGRGHERDFNPRSPCGERRGRPKGRIIGEKFQPTLPMRGATATYCVAHYIFTRYSQIS